MPERATFHRLASFVGCTIALVLSIAPNALAQLSADPYNPWNSQYESYVYPSVPGGSGGVYSNQAAYSLPSGIRGANRFSEAMEDYDRPSADGEGPRVPLRRGVGIPYTRAYRDYDKMYNRIYTPNQNGASGAIDDQFNATRQKREEAYSDFRLAETPEERAESRKNYAYYNRQSLRELMLGGRNSRASAAARARRPSSERTESPSRRPRTSNLSSGDSLDAIPPRPSSTSIAGSRSGRGTLPSSSAGSNSRRSTTGSRDPGSRKNPRNATGETDSRGSGSVSPIDVLRRSQRMNRGRIGDPAGRAPASPDR